MTVRAKFIVNTITMSRQSVYDHERKQSVTKVVHSIKLFPVTGSGGEENERFWASTPSGSIELNVVNPEATAQFMDQLGGAVYVDFTPAD